MRLNRIRIAGFKSFVDPTVIPLPGGLTGIVGPNGCGKSNVIDAVRWVMGELSARHLRGDSMVDVIFNGSSGRKPIGTATVELVFDNGDGRIGGAYANYAEVSLKRTVERDGTSQYFINGARCRRRDITQLFLGTGLGSRSYAIIEQGTISRIIEARPEEMRDFIEEAAGISLYKERRRETEGRIADTRENLARVGDLREEVDKQIRHLQRQANAARRYQDLRAQERQVTAELLALRLRQLDGLGAGHERDARAAELAMQQALADQRESEAGIERQRVAQQELGDALARVQTRYYEFGAEVTRTEQSLRYGRERCERAGADLQQAGAGLDTVAQQIGHDERQLAALRARLAEVEPQVESRRRQERVASDALAGVEAELAVWQQRWEAFHAELGAATRALQVESARIEQLEHQRLRLQGQGERLAQEHAALASPAQQSQLRQLTDGEAVAAGAVERLERELLDALAEVQRLRAAQPQCELQLQQLRGQREQAHDELLSLQALQRAALHEQDPQSEAWLRGLSGAAQERLAETLQVDAGWERAVETALGDYLEARGVAALEVLESALPRLATGQVAFFEQPSAALAGAGRAGTLAAHVRAGPPVLRLLERVHTAASLSEALRRRRELGAGESLICASGEWLGPDWLRVNRGGDARSGVLEREQRLKELRERCGDAEARVVALEQQLAALRTQLAAAEQQCADLQQRLQGAHREHAELRGRLAALTDRLQQAQLRRQRIDSERQELARELTATADSLARAQEARSGAADALTGLEQRRAALEQERELRRADTAAARERAQAAQVELRDALVGLESQRSAEGAAQTALQRLQQQRAALLAQRAELERTLAESAAPLADLERGLQQHLERRLQAERELAGARAALEECEQQLRMLEHGRLAAEQRVGEARAALERARLAAQEARLRRESLLEQFAQTQCELTTVQAALGPETQVEPTEQRLAALRADLERLGQVNLAAISELAEQSERKAYLDRQFADVNEALQTLEQAMRKIDRETRSRFEDTFSRISTGLQQIFPRLFGGGNASLELIGEDPLTAGVAVMARPPGKRNSTIAQLSGGEKALTSIALVLAIFELNPAPFCMLDEIDAPLDESNIGRFCEMVRHMSSRVQFVFITHNRVTMELASQLIGVTMNEPGVSRLVSVDVDAAVKLAAV